MISRLTSVGWLNGDKCCKLSTLQQLQLNLSAAASILSIIVSELQIHAFDKDPLSTCLVAVAGIRFASAAPTTTSKSLLLRGHWCCSFGFEELEHARGARQRRERIQGMRCSRSCCHLLMRHMRLCKERR